MNFGGKPGGIGRHPRLGLLATGILLLAAVLGYAPDQRPLPADRGPGAGPVAPGGGGA